MYLNQKTPRCKRSLPRIKVTIKMLRIKMGGQGLLLLIRLIFDDDDQAVKHLDGLD